MNCKSNQTACGVYTFNELHFPLSDDFKYDLAEMKTIPTSLYRFGERNSLSDIVFQ